MREGLGYEEEADDLKINLGEHLLRAVFARPASSAWVSQGASPSSQYAPQAFRTPTYEAAEFEAYSLQGSGVASPRGCRVSHVLCTCRGGSAAMDLRSHLLLLFGQAGGLSPRFWPWLVGTA